MKKSTHTTEYRAILSALQKSRESGGLSQRALAARLQVHPSWVAKVETGERRIDLLEFHWFITACDGDSIQAFQQLHAQFTSPSGKRAARGGRSG